MVALRENNGKVGWRDALSGRVAAGQSRRRGWMGWGWIE
jgi:hypothetical protein